MDGILIITKWNRSINQPKYGKWSLKKNSQLEFSMTGMNLVKTTPSGWKISAQGHPTFFNEWQRNPHTTRQTAASRKTPLYTGTTKYTLGT